MEKVKDAVRARITEIADTEEDDGLDSYIQKKLDSFLPPLGTAPSHPPYASVILSLSAFFDFLFDDQFYFIIFCSCKLGHDIRF